MHSFLDKIASIKIGNLIFSDWLSEEDRAVIETGWNDWKKGFFTENRGKAMDLYKQGDFALYRLLTDTTDYLMYVGDPRNINRIYSFEEFWRKEGYLKIADALKVRLDEAMYEEEYDVELPDFDDELESGPKAEEMEEAPITMRSVAKALKYIRIFTKMVTG